MLQNYLSANLLSLTSDEDFKKLKKSADDIAKKISKNKAKIVTYTLLAIDPSLSVDNTDIVEIKNIIIKNWSTFASNAKDTPLTYIRAVLLETLSSMSRDINHSLLIWFASRNVVLYHSLTGKEKDIILDFLSKLGNNINQIANREWALSGHDILPKINVELKEISKYLINDDILKKYLEDASGPTNSQGVNNFDRPNQYWSNNAQNWSFQFAPIAAKGIKSSVDASLKAIASVTNENRNIIQDNLNKALEQIQKEVSNKTHSLQLRSELLWWKEARYSPLMDKSYDELDKNIKEIVLAYDYSSFIPIIYPKSVDYFLKATYKELKESTKEELTLENFLKMIQEHSEELKLIFPEGDALTGKSTFVNFINGFIWNKYQLAQFEKIVGIPLKVKLSPSELTTWLFHDFQLIKILNTK